MQILIRIILILFSIRAFAETPSGSTKENRIAKWLGRSAARLLPAGQNDEKLYTRAFERMHKRIVEIQNNPIQFCSGWSFSIEGNIDPKICGPAMANYCQELRWLDETCTALDSKLTTQEERRQAHSAAVEFQHAINDTNGFRCAFLLGAAAAAMDYSSKNGPSDKICGKDGQPIKPSTKMWKHIKANTSAGYLRVALDKCNGVGADERGSLDRIPQCLQRLHPDIATPNPGKSQEPKTQP